MATYSQEGDANLLALHKATKFTDWMYEQIQPYLFGDILEVGSGVGTYSEKVIRDFKGKITLSDIDATYVAKLKKKYAKKKNVQAKVIDLMQKKSYSNSVDCVFALNVLEHIEDDMFVLENMYKMLKPGGRFIVLVPAHKWLYNSLDKSIDHYRRYTKKDMLAKVAKTKFKVTTLFYFNIFAIPGWYVNGNILKQTEVGAGPLKLFNALTPIFRGIEKFFTRGKLGISLIVVLEKEKR